MKNVQNSGKISTQAHVARFLRYQLKNSHKTQEEFAMYVNTCERNLRRWLKGSGIGCSQIDSFSEKFGVSVKDIVTFGDDVLPLFMWIVA